MEPDRWKDLGLALISGGSLATAAWLVPGRDHLGLPGGASVPVVCWLRDLSDISCPTCGMTRSFVAFMHAEVRESFSCHPAGPALLAGMAVTLVSVVALAVMRRPPLWGRPFFATATLVLGIGCVGAGISRYLFI